MATRRGVNVYLISHDETAVLVDSGTPDMAKPLLKSMSSEPALTDLKLSDVVLTHGHYDHAGGAADIASSSGATVWAHPAEGDLLRRGEWRRDTAASPTLHGRLLTALVANRYPDRLTPIREVQQIADIIPIANGLRAHHLPGHALGQLAIEWKASDGKTTIFAGDVFMDLFGPREPILYEDRLVGLRSISALADLAKTADRIALGHGGPLEVTEALLRKIRQLSNP